MDVTEIGKKLGLSESKHVIRKAAKLHRLCDFQFDCSAIGIGETCMAVICLEIAATRYKDQFLKSLPATRRASADFTRPVFTAVAFYLCAKKHRLKVDKKQLYAANEQYALCPTIHFTNMCVDLCIQFYSLLLPITLCSTIYIAGIEVQIQSF